MQNPMPLDDVVKILKKSLSVRRKLPRPAVLFAVARRASAVLEERGAPGSLIEQGGIPIGEGSIPIGEGSVPIGEGSIPIGEGSIPIGEGSIPIGEGSLFGKGLGGLLGPCDDKLANATADCDNALTNAVTDAEDSLFFCLLGAKTPAEEAACGHAYDVAIDNAYSAFNTCNLEAALDWIDCFAQAGKR